MAVMWMREHCTAAYCDWAQHKVLPGIYFGVFSAMFTFVADHQAADARKPTRPSSACKAVSKLVRRGVEYGVQATESKFKLAHDQLRDLSQSTVGSVGKC